jgi:nitrate reductase gamma subunit
MNMHDLYSFVSGPMVWIAFAVFLGGLVWQFVSIYLLARRKDPMVIEYISLKYAVRSIAHWSTPYATRSWRLHPLMTLATFAFHISIFLAPIFLLAHLVLIQENFGIALPALPDWFADILTIVVILSLAYFVYRRIAIPEVRFVTEAKDYGIIALVLAPFLTGFLAYHQLGPAELMLILHMLTGQAMLMAIPFTRLGHMIVGPLIRAYMGSEFGGVRHAQDW